MAKTKMDRDKEGFIVLKPIPGGRFDEHKKKKKIKGTKVPKNPDKLISIFADEYGMDAVADMTEVNIGDYVYEKGIIHSLNMNVGRNIPWLEDGLKAVERRILYTMYKKKEYGGKYDKVATVSGNIISMFHPHGDQALNDTIYRLGRARSTMIPYIKPSGNYGNMEDMRPAAPRYASASLSAYAMDCFFSEMGAKYPIFDVKDSYQYAEKEPIFLVSRYPNILMQWNLGIGKGAAAWLGAFNSKDIFNAALKMLDNPKAKIDIYPDTPIPVDIINKSELKGCFDQKNFPVRMRAQYEIVADKKRDERGHIVDKFTIVFTSLPLNVTGQVVKNEIIKIKEEDLKRNQADKKLPEVMNIEIAVSNNTPGGIRFIVEYEKGYDPIALAEKLFRSTSLGTTVSVRYVLINDNQPHEFTPRQIMNNWINQRYDQKRRYYHQMALKCAKDRARLEASCILLETNNIDKAIKIIKTAKDDQDAVNGLMKEFKFTEFQATIVLRLELRSLNKMNVNELKKQRDQAVADYKFYRKMLTDENAVKEAIREELQEGLKKYGKDRLANVFTMKDRGDTADPDGVKRIYWNSEYYLSAQTPEEQKALRGRLDKNTRVIEFQNSSKVLIFSKNGQVKLLDGFAFTPTTSGIAFAQIAFPDVVGIIPVTKQLSEVALVTSAGYGKTMVIDDVLKSTKTKIITMSAGDNLIGVVPVYGNKSGLVVMCAGEKMFYSKLEDLPLLKRVSAGNRLVKVDNGTINHVFYLAGPADYILVYGEYGYMKVLDARVLKFNKRKPVAIMLGKEIMGAVPVDAEHGPYVIYDEISDTEININIGKMVELVTVDSKESHKFKIGTSISTAVKVLKKGRNEFYQIQETK